MDTKQELRQLCQEQINELLRLAAETQASADLLRQEAHRVQRLLDEGMLSEATLREMTTRREALRMGPDKLARASEGLM